MSDCNWTDISDCYQCDELEKDYQKLKEENQALKQRLDRAMKLLTKIDQWFVGSADKNLELGKILNLLELELELEEKKTNP